MRNKSLAVFLGSALVAFAAVFLSGYAWADLPPSPKGQAYDTAVTANTDILAADAASQQPTAYRITIAIKDGATDSITNLVYNDGSTDIVLALNSGTALSAGQLYTFTAGCSKDWTLNIQTEDNTTIGVLLIEAIRDGVL